jgi:hypothetical protein
LRESEELAFTHICSEFLSQFACFKALAFHIKTFKSPLYFLCYWKIKRFLKVQFYYVSISYYRTFFTGREANLLEILPLDINNKYKRAIQDLGRDISYYHYQICTHALCR